MDQGPGHEGEKGYLKDKYSSPQHDMQIAALMTCLEHFIAELGTKHHLDRTPTLPCYHVQVTGERNARQEVREEDIYCTDKDQLIEHRPV